MNSICYYTTTTHAPRSFILPSLHIHHTPHTNRPTQSGQHFPLFLGLRDTPKHLPQLPGRTDRPVHAANTQQCTRVTPPPQHPTRRVKLPTQHYPPPAPRVTSQTACRHLRGRVVVRHLPARPFGSHSVSAPVKQNGRDRQTDKRRTGALRD
jgi:hypothetical protein